MPIFKPSSKISRWYWGSWFNRYARLRAKVDALEQWQRHHDTNGGWMFFHSGSGFGVFDAIAAIMRHLDLEVEHQNKIEVKKK